MKGRILYGSPTAVHGGAEEVLLKFMRAARELDYEPLLLVPGAGWLTDQCRADGIAWEALPSLPSPFVDSAWHQFKPWLPNAVNIARILRRRNAALVHSNTPRLSYHAGLAARLAGIPAVTHVHDIVRLPYASRAKARLLSSLADRTLTVSHAVKDAVLRSAPWMASRIQVVYNGWDASVYRNVGRVDWRARYGFPEEALVIGNVSAMTSWKGQDVLIDAFSRLHRDLPLARLVIVGGAQNAAIQGAYEAGLHARARQTGLSDAVLFTGWREDAWDFINSFDIMVHAPTRPDPLPTVLLHASALGQAMVASRTGGIPEIVEDNVSGCLVAPGNIDELHAALSRLAADAPLRRRLGQQAAARFQRIFSWNQLKTGLAAAYEACLTPAGALRERT